MQCASAPCCHSSNLADCEKLAVSQPRTNSSLLFVPVHSGLLLPATLHSCLRPTNLHSVVSLISLLRLTLFDPVSGRWHHGSTLSAVRFVVIAVVSSGSIEGQRASRIERRGRGPSARNTLTSFQSKKNDYWTERVNNERRTPSKLWRSMASILCRAKNRGESETHTGHTADAFLQFFENKVHTVRSTTEGYPPAEVKATTTTSFLSFHACSANDIRRIIMKSPTKSCNLDPIPTFVLKESLVALLPFLTAMCNASILEGKPAAHSEARHHHAYSEKIFTGP